MRQCRLTAAFALSAACTTTSEPLALDTDADPSAVETDASASDIHRTPASLDAQNSAGVTAAEVLALVGGATTFSASASAGEADLGLLATGTLTLTVDAANASAFSVALYDKTWSEVSVPCSLSSEDDAVMVSGTLSLAYTDLDDVAWAGTTSVPSAGLTGTWPAGVMTGAEALWTDRTRCSEGRPFTSADLWIGGDLHGDLATPTMSIMMLWADCGTGDALAEIQLTR